MYDKIVSHKSFKILNYHRTSNITNYAIVQNLILKEINKIFYQSLFSSTFFSFEVIAYSILDNIIHLTQNVNTFQVVIYQVTIDLFSDYINVHSG